MRHTIQKFFSITMCPKKILSYYGKTNRKMAYRDLPAGGGPIRVLKKAGDWGGGDFVPIGTLPCLRKPKQATISK